MYPGDPCVYPTWTEHCAYGTQKWVEGYCESVGHNGKCAESKDCPSHQYCAGSTGTGFDGTCTQFKAIGEECDHVYECGRTATCWFNDPNQVKGKCKDYFQISSGDTSNPVYQTLGNNTKFTDDSHLMCSSQYYNPDTGVCEDGAKSLNKGKRCNTDQDCPSNIAGVYAKCTCGWNTNGYKYCDILAGDDEWEIARTKFRQYFDATKDDCNVAARWEKCSQPGLYTDWRCEQLKAENYVYLLYDSEELPCMKTLKESLPIFKEIEEMWNNAMHSNFMMLLMAVSMVYLLI